MYYFLNFFIISKKSVSWTPFFEDLKPLAKEKKNLTMNHLQARACHFPQLLLLEGSIYRPIYTVYISWLLVKR